MFKHIKEIKGIEVIRKEHVIFKNGEKNQVKLLGSKIWN